MVESRPFTQVVNSTRKEKRGDFRQHARPGGAGHLVLHDAQSLLPARPFQYFCHKIIASQAVHPAGAQDEIRPACGLNGALAFQFCASVMVDRVRDVYLGIGRALRA